MKKLRRFISFPYQFHFTRTLIITVRIRFGDGALLSVMLLPSTGIGVRRSDGLLLRVTAVHHFTDVFADDLF